MQGSSADASLLVPAREAQPREAGAESQRWLTQAYFHFALRLQIKWSESVAQRWEIVDLSSQFYICRAGACRGQFWTVHFHKAAQH